MADDWKEYVNDPRTVCKYGAKCYQKNSEHNNNFKHPPLKKKIERNKRRPSPYARPALDVDKKTANTKKPDDEAIIQTEAVQNTTKTEEKVIIKLPDEIKYYDKDADISIIKELFLVEMPIDFFKFYEFLNSIGESIEKTLSNVNLELIGPYDLLLGKLPVLEDKELYLIHWRFFYDPPEFQSVIKKKRSEYHIGYYRDAPEQTTAFLASNDSSKGYHITPMSYNIFGAVYLYLQNEKSNSPFMTAPCTKLSEKIKTYAEENSITLTEFNMIKRQSEIVAKCFHSAGIVVPYNKKTQRGYRRLAETDAKLKKMFTNLQNATSQQAKDEVLSDLQVIVTNAIIAVDECDFGTGLELGIDVFCSGLKELHSIALSNLTAAYSVLNRKTFAQIAEAHLKYRRKGPNMSILD